MARSKVKSRPHHDIAHLHPLTNVPTKYQLPTAGQTFPAAYPPDHPDTMGENNAPTALKDCVVKMPKIFINMWILRYIGKGKI